MAVFTKSKPEPMPTMVPAPKPVRVSHCCLASCTTCLPHRVAHWACAQCQSGPYRFAASDPGSYKVLRPHFEKTSQQYVMNDEGVGRWVYTVRRICSAGCWQREIRNIRSEEMDVAQRRPDLAPAIEAKHTAESAMEQEFQDDLSALDGLPANTNPGQF